MADRNWANGGKMYQMETSPVMVSCKFTVNAADSAGKGITNLKGPTVNAVYMHTSATPATGNPNPASGTIVVQLQNNYNLHIADLAAMIESPGSGSDLKIDNSALTAGVAYVISVLGDATAAKWHAIGVPAGITPAVGVAFIAASDGGSTNTSSSRVQATATNGSGVAAIEIVGKPSLSVAPKVSANQGYGASIILQCYDYAGAKVAPADGSTISLLLQLSNSSVSVQGE